MKQDRSYTPGKRQKKVVLVTREDRKVIRYAAHLIGEAAGELRDSMTLQPTVLGAPREWPIATHEDRQAKSDYDESLETVASLMRIANRRPK